MKRVIIVLAIISLITFLYSSFLFFRAPVVLQVIEFPASVSVTENVVGFDLNSSALVFGSIVKGSKITRRVSVENKYSFDIKAQFKFYGEITPLFEKISFIKISSGETKSIPISIISKMDTSFGNYSGFVKIELSQYSQDI